MRIVLFDLGGTLESNSVPLPGALETLQAITGLRSSTGDAVVLGLVSDFHMPGIPAEIPGLRQQYFSILDQLGLRSFFEPVEAKTTLSTEVGVFKPDARIFRAAIEKIDPAATLEETLFITENRVHVDAARLLGMQAVHVREPGQSTGDVERLEELVPLVRAFLG